MEQENIQQAAIDQALVPTDDQAKIGLSKMRIDPKKTLKEATYQVILDILKLSPCYNALLITVDVPEIYMQLKFISKGELTQVYGMFIPDEMMNDEIKNSVAYQTYLALSTGTKPPKKGRDKAKDLMSKKVATPVPEKKKKSVPKKKGSITIEENILSDPDEEQALEVNKEAAEHQKKKKMKGIVTDIPKGSSKGSGSKPKVPDEPKDVHEDDEVHDDDRKHDDDKAIEEEIVKDKTTDDEKDDEEITDTAKVDEEMADTEKEKPKFPSSSSSVYLSSDYGNQFINVSFDVSLVRIIKETTNAEINSMLDVPIQQEIPSVQRAPLLDVLVTVIPIVTTPTLSITLPTIEIQAITVTTTDLSATMLLRLSKLERKVEALSKVDHFEVIEESLHTNVRNEVKNQIPKAAESFSEYELKKILFDKMDRSRSNMTHDKHQELYDALLNSMYLDDTIESGEANPDKVLRKRHRDENQDAPTGSDKEKKRSRKGKDSKPSKDKAHIGSSKGKTPPNTSKTGKSMTTEESVKELVHEVAMDLKELILDDVLNDFNDLVNAKKDSLTFDELMETPIDFSKFAMNRLKLDKITKADLVGPVYKLVNETCQSSIELKYNMDQCYNALTDQLDWINPKGDRCPYELSKPLPLQGSPGHLTILVDFFINNDLEYLKTGNSERKYTASITKIKSTRSQINRISKQDVYTTMKIMSVLWVKVDKRLGYGYLKEIVNKLFNLLGDDIVNLVRMFTRSLVIKKRVEDVQLRVEIYQKKLNVIKPQKEFFVSTSNNTVVGDLCDPIWIELVSTGYRFGQVYELTTQSAREQASMVGPHGIEG
uniref:Uncharacterized protein n=1 Tax=Tanacetum cinerariifolium TaxID=118510 RepID=A0A6L2L491_TANCI|nr:hypothetical protein [Tanacetum cinerariifolium]